MSFNNWPIRLKLGVGFGTLLLICAAIGLLAITVTSRFAAMLSEMHDNSLQQVVTLSTAHDMVLDHNRDLLALLLDQKQSFLLLDHLDETRTRAKETLATLRQGALPPAEQAQLATFDREWAIYLSLANKALELELQGHHPEALRLLNGEVNPAFLSAEDKLLRLIELNNSSAHDILSNNRAEAKNFVLQLVLAMITAIGAGIFLAWRCTRAIVEPIRMAADVNSRLAVQSSTLIGLADAIADGDLQQEIPSPEKFIIPREIIHGDETGTLLQSARHMSDSQAILTRAMSKMTGILSRNQAIEQRSDWLKSGLNHADELLRGDKQAQQLAGELLPFLVSYLNAAVGALYLYDRAEETLYLATTWALPKEFRPKERLDLGEGLLGQAAKERRAARFTNMPADYLPVTSALGSAPTCEVIAQPLVHDGELFGAIELGSLHLLPEEALELLDQIAGNLALALKVARSREQIGDLLEQAQQQAEELRVQQEELQQSNEELEERAQLLEQQREQIGAQNREIEATAEQLRHKAVELERISAYKSEFLANMSHELRSPLNSLLILSSLLQDNREGNLTEKQVKFAATINNAGKDLLALINDILDLSKVEAGKLQLHCEPTPVRELCAELRALCQPQFDAKGLTLKITVADDADEIDTDRQRLQQILRNLLSNACKFTDRGEVTVTVRGLRPGEGGLRAAGLAFEVRDTGIGIAPDKQQLIFEAFQQEDGSTSRRYGGTGLGLSIALQLARHMGGNIRLASVPGQGSTFTLNLPLQTPLGDTPEPAAIAQLPECRETVPPDELPQPLPDDRANLAANDRTILVVEDDLAFAQLLADMVRARRFKALIAADGESGIAMADRYQPSAIILDIMLPHIDGWAVMRHLKDNPRTRHIPVHFVSCLDEAHKALGMGAVGYVRKPVTPGQLDEVFGTIEQAVEQTGRRLLIVEDNEHEAKAMVALLGERNVEITVVPSGKAAIAELAGGHFDCIVLDLGLADTTGFVLLEHLRAQKELHRIPVIIHSGQEISREDELRLRRFTESIIIKGTRSPDRLLNEVTLFLHLVESGLSPGKQQMIREVLDKEAMLEGKRVLIVDDDMRNIFSLANILAEKQLTIFEAENGREALARLDEHPDIDLVLMDIMMPGMDGYEATRAIRKDERFRRLPVIAMTAKALKGDQEKCLEAGASDYISKPIDPDKLFSLLRVWLYPGSLA